MPFTTHEFSPVLPPLDIPQDPQFLPLLDTPPLVRSPTPSFTSKDSFATAHSSVSPLPPRISPVRAPFSLSPPQSLRKSISVDSFVHYGRDSQPPVPSRPNRVNTSSALDSPRPNPYSSSPVLPRDREQSGRDRGASVSSSRDAYESSCGVDSDVERSDPLHSPVERYRHPSLKEQARPFVRAGELPLPARTHTLSSTSSMSSMITTSTDSSTLEDVPRMHSVSSLQSLPHRSTPFSAPGRVRSGSLGVYMPNSGKRSQMPNRDLTGLYPPVTLVVIGVARCGKSTVIRKGLKSFALSDPGPYFAPSNTPGSSTPACYTRRIGRISQIANSHDCPLHVLEVEIQPAAATDILPPGSVWPANQRIDGAIICYDSSNVASFQPVENLLGGYHAMKIPTVVLACKSDLEHRVEPEKALEVLQKYDVGLVEVTKSQDQGKDKMRLSFDWLIKAVFRDKRTNRSYFDSYRNPASPGVLTSPPLHGSIPAPPPRPRLPRLQLLALDQPPRCYSASDLTLEENGEDDNRNDPKDSAESLHESRTIDTSSVIHIPEGKEPKELRPAQWATLDELLDKLLFLAVSGDDPSFVTHFLLTYRRFASPRSILLAMQKRLRQLDTPAGDPVFTCFSQMRISLLLLNWMREYPYDFLVPGTAGALSALIKSILSKTYLVHYATDYFPFLEMLPSLVDQDAAWAIKVEDIESDDDSFIEDDDEPEDLGPETESLASSSQSPTSILGLRFPLARSLPSGAIDSDLAQRHLIRDLTKLAQDVMVLDSDHIAQEITRIEVGLFLDIQPRNWLNYTFVSLKKENEPISTFNALSNHLADWVVSLILCHDRPRNRAKQMEKFVDIAQRLRVLNNYSALRAFVAGINNATFPGDETMEQFKLRSPDHAKNLQSWDVLLQHIRSHRAYRLALRNTKGACIPALYVGGNGLDSVDWDLIREVHMSDLIRAHEGNEDSHPSDPTKIHWGKFNMMGKFINMTRQCQTQCRVSTDYSGFPERTAISELFLRRQVMDNDMQKSRIASPDPEIDYSAPTAPLPGGFWGFLRG
ncbi:ras guanine nucleotide exchange factor domain-containing protein [Infundibulicybe gibba]|nr:ras guanine nucleotide exchange factor domain-containing protein [Infundibulicybe gibba]